MKKSVEILGLPIISITEGRELGVSKSLLIDAKNGAVAAITIEDDDWYRGVKLIPYEAIIAIGEDAVTITHSENILNLDEAGDYERLLVENVRVIGTKAITKGGYIQGNVTEVFVGDGGKIEQCEITSPDNAVNYVTAEQISIFGKQVTVIDIGEEKKNSLIEQPAFEPAFEAFSEEPPQEVWTPTPVEEPPVMPIENPSEVPNFSLTEETQPQVDLTLPPEEEPVTTEETQAQLEEVMMPDPIPDTLEKPVEPPKEEPSQEELPQEESPVEESPKEELPQIESPVEEPSQKELPQIESPVEEPPKEELPQEEPPVEEPPKEEPPKAAELSEEDKKIAAMTQQAEDLKAALKKARANQQTPPPEQKPMVSQKKQVEKAVDERRRRVLLGKHATKTITAESGTIVVEAGAEVTEEVLQRARLSNKFIELSMNVQ